VQHVLLVNIAQKDLSRRVMIVQLDYSVLSGLIHHMQQLILTTHMLTASNKQFNVLRATNVLKQLHILCHVMQGSTKIGMAKHNANFVQPLHTLNL